MIGVTGSMDTQTEIRTIHTPRPLVEFILGTLLIGWYSPQIGRPQST